MTINLIRDTCINAAELYYNYLKENNKGRSEIIINRITPVIDSPDFYKLDLSGKLFDTDAIVFLHRKLNQEFDSAQIRIKEYDYDKNILIIRVSENLPFSFKTIDSSDMLIISDLKFLVKNVKEFFIKNGDKIKLPQTPSDNKIKISDFKFLPNSNPNENQKEALLSIFKNPFTYIWGAPGTGKTRYVLAYSILRYIELGKKVAIFAPTNIALEQVLRGILEITDKAEIERNKIIRIGNPSRRFAEEYPEVCEVSGIQKKIQELSNQIRILENILGIDENSQDGNSIQQLIQLSGQWNEINAEFLELDSQYKTHNALLNKHEREYKIIEEQIKVKKQAILNNEKKLGSLSHRIIKSFSKNPTYREQRNSTLYNELKTLFDTDNEIKLKLNEFLDAKDKIHFELTKYKNDLASINEQIFAVSFSNQKLSAIFKKTSLNTLSETIIQLNNEWTAISETHSISSSIKESYSSFSDLQLRVELKRFKEQKEKFASYDTEERLKNVNVIGATLDGYIGRFPDANLKADHYFIDEAGYANIIKTLSVFVYDKPITLLGDHMQLPPVFEMNKDDIKEENSDLYAWGQSAIFTEYLFGKTKQECFNGYVNNDEFVPVFSVKTVLNCTHRFGKNLAEILNNLVYKNGFTSNKTEGNTIISFIHADKCPSQNKRDNVNEIKAIENYLSLFHPSEYSILTPYNNQIHYLKNRLPNVFKEDRLLSVHKSQGREWDIVILSVCDTNNMWFTDSLRQITNGKNLINTAVSRAKKELIIVCDYNFWIKQNGQLIQGLLSIAKEKKLS